MNKRAHRTEQAAKQLIKSRARRHVYSALSKQTDGVAYNTMVALEDAIMEEAQREWQAVHATWVTGFERLALLPIIEKVALEAYRECRSAFDEGGLRWAAVRSLQEFFEEFDPKGMLT